MTDPALISVVGFSGAGKTTLLEKLIHELASRGYRVGTIKHDVHGFEMDKPGKDSWDEEGDDSSNGGRLGDGRALRRRRKDK